MNGFDDLPDDPAERAVTLQEMLVSRACGGHGESDAVYRSLRKEFMDGPGTASLLPPFVRTCQTLSAFWAWIKKQSSTYEGRSNLIRIAFEPLLSHLEGGNQFPGDPNTNDVLLRFDAYAVHNAWERALGRRLTDPEGAITAARTLLETVCKHILDEQTIGYGPNDDLPKLYGAVTKHLNLAPSQHTEEAFRTILGGCHSVINGLSTLRNRIGDAHGQGSRSIKPAMRHAALAVNLAGAMATFLVDTLEHRATLSQADPVDE